MPHSFPTRRASDRRAHRAGPALGIGDAGMTGARPLAGKAAIVSGGGRGLGRAIALRLARDGADVAILSRSPEPLAEALDALLAAGGSGIGNVRSEEHTSELQSLMRSSYAVFCLQKKKKTT